MISALKTIIMKIVNLFGFNLVRINAFYAEDDGAFMRIYKSVEPFTMSSIETILSLYRSVKYIVRNQIEGDVVICGAWKGGCAMLCALTLLSLGQTDKKIYLYDTFCGMTKPTEKDKSSWGLDAQRVWQKHNNKNKNDWCCSSLNETKKNLASTGYPQQNLCFVEGDIQESIPKIIPQNISLLRLDTDFFESTQHELIHLFPLLLTKGVIHIDDYEMWLGQQEAVNEYFKKHNIHILLHRIDSYAACGIKV